MTLLDAPPQPPRLDLRRGTRSQTALTRLARRTARGGGWRHLLVVGLIALSVAAATAVAIGARSSRPTPAQQLAWRFGDGDLRLDVFDGGDAAFEDLPAELQRFVRASGLPVVEREPSRDPLVLLDQVAPHAEVAGITTVWAPAGGDRDLQLIAAEVTHPLLAPMWRIEGAAPAPGEALLTPRAMERYGVEVGEQVELPIVGAVTVVGEVVLPTSVREVAAIVDEGADLGRRADRAVVAAVGGDDPSGVAHRLHQLLTDLPVSVETRRSMASAIASGDDGSATEEPTFVGIVLGAVLLTQVAFVAAAAFATGTRRRLRQLGLLGAIGADARQIQGLVLREALVLGTVGGVAGAGLGLLGAWLGRPVIQLASSRPVDTLAVHPLDLLAPAVLGILAAVVAAFLPARTAGRVPAVTALAGRLPVRTIPRWVAPASVVLSIAGLVLVGVAVRSSSGYGVERQLAIAGGTVATVLGAAALSVPALGLLGRFADRLPARARLVVRDTVRQRSRSAAAVAALTVVLVVPVVFATSATTDAARWQPTTEQRRDAVIVSGPWYDGSLLPPTAGMVDHVEAAVPPVESRTSIPTYGLPGTSRAYVTFGARDGGDGAPFQGYFDRLGLASPGVLAALGIDDVTVRPDTVVVVDVPFVLRDQLPVEGRAPLRLERHVAGEDLSEVIAAPTVTVVHAESAIAAHPLPPLLLAPQLAEELGLVETGGSVLLDVARDLTRGEYEQVHQLGDAAPVRFSVNASGNFSAFDPAPAIAIVLGIALVVALIISGMTAALAATESDRDLELMTAVGAEPRLRRRFHGMQAGYHTLLAAVLAIPSGLLLTRAVTVAWADGLGLVIPWAWLAAVLFGLPLLVGLAHRSLMRSSRVRAPRRIT